MNIRQEDVCIMHERSTPQGQAAEFFVGFSPCGGGGLVEPRAVRIQQSGSQT